MSSQTDSDCAHPIPDDTVSHQAEEGRSSCLFVVVRAAFQRKKIWKFLEESGNFVCRFIEPTAVLAAIGTISPDVILCEVAVSTEPVFELLNRLAGVESDACVILIGPDLGVEQVAQSLRSGAFDYLTAPVPASRILDSLQRAS